MLSPERIDIGEETDIEEVELASNFLRMELLTEV